MALDYAKLDLARRTLTAVHPWWTRYFSRYKFHDMDGGIVHTDNQWNMFFNPVWLATASVDDVSGAMRFALNWSLRRFDQRFPSSIYTDDKPESRFIPLAQSMEVTTSILSSPSGLTEQKKQELLSLELSDSLLTTHNITGSLPLPPGCWNPEAHGLPAGKTAEHYVHLLSSIDNGLKNLSEPPSDGGDPLTPEDMLKSIPEDARDLFHNSANSGHESMDDVIADWLQDERTRDSSDTHDAENNNDTDATGENSTTTSPNDTPRAGQGSGSTQDCELHADACEWALSPHDDITRQPDPESGDIGVTDNDWKDALTEFAQDIQQASLTPGMGTPNGYAITLANNIVTVKSTGWRRRLTVAMTRSATGVSQSGMMDLSYSKRNPNQREGEPLMPGLVMHPATFMVLVDVSGSMHNVLHRVMSDVMDILTHVLAKFGQPITYVCADTEIQYAKQMFAPNKKPELPLTGSGGTHGFGDIIERIATQGFRYNNRRFMKPDMLIVFTDGGFEWPFPHQGKLLGDTSEIMIGCTTSYSDIRDHLPPWVKNNVNFIHIEEDKVTV